MERLTHFFHLFKHCYYLDEQDYYFVTTAANRVINLMIPLFIGPWIFGNIYLIGNKDLPKAKRRSIKLFPLLTPFLSIELVYFLYYYNNPDLAAILEKYPRAADLKQRPRLDIKKLKQAY